MPRVDKGVKKIKVYGQIIRVRDRHTNRIKQSIGVKIFAIIVKDNIEQPRE